MGEGRKFGIFLSYSCDISDKRNIADWGAEQGVARSSGTRYKASERVLRVDIRGKAPLHTETNIGALLLDDVEG